MKKLVLNILLLLFALYNYAQERILTPIGSTVKDEIIQLDDDQKLSNGFFPVTNAAAHRTIPQKDTARSWFYRKLFQEHFIQQKGRGYFIAVDPLIHLSAGQEQLQGSDALLFRNMRGAQAQGQLGEKFTFYTAFFENQARFADFRSSYFESRGEQRFNGQEYITSNAVIPNGGRTKPFKTDAFDYASSMSYIRFEPIESLRFHFGNDPSFLGWGHRSMLLSDNSFNFTRLKIDWEILPGLNYTWMRGKQLNLLRKRFTNLIEPPFERKGIGLHYLSYSPDPALSIGVFESSVYLRDKATGDQPYSNYFYQPLIGVNTAAVGSENQALRNFMGINIGWRLFSGHMLYTQAISGDIKNEQYGIQVGYRASDLFTVPHLNVQVEYNKATSRLYASGNRRLAFTHFNLPLAHTLGNGFEELVLRANYRWKGITLKLKHIYYEANQMMPFKDALFASKNDMVINTPVTVNYTSAELGYLMNERTMLTVFARGIYRQSSSSTEGNVNHGLVFFGVKSDLFNNYMDF
ncbi:MAG: hypothetical protein ACQERC_03495 [Bacteroidota bacterium]